MSISVARHLRKRPTDAETRLWSRLRGRQLDGRYFRRQVAMGQYVVDFVCHREKLVIEIDGGQHASHLSEDRNRTAWLEGEGYRVARFWNNDVLANTEGVLEATRQALTTSPPP